MKTGSNLKKRLRMLKYAMTSICLMGLGIVLAGNSAKAIDFLPSGYNNQYALQNPTVVFRSGSYSGNMIACGSYVDILPQAQTGLYLSIANGGGCYPSSANDFTLHSGDLIHVQITGAKGFISSYNIGFFEGASGTFLGLTNHSLGEDSIVDLYFLANNVSSYNTRFEFKIQTGTISQPNIIKVTAFNVWSLPSGNNYNATLTNIENELKQCGGNATCEQNYLKRWVFEIYGVTVDISTAVTDIGSDVSDIKDILDNLDTDLQDLADNSDEELNTNKTEKSNIENQSASDISNASDQKTESLMSAFGSFITVVSSVRPSNCVINGGVRTEFNMGMLDFCSLPVPGFVTIIGSLLLVIIVVGLTVSILKRIFGLIREMQS